MLKLEKKILNIISIYKQLKSSQTLTPSLKINELFTELVSICMRTNTADATLILQDYRISSIQQQLNLLCSEGEWLLENTTATNVIESNNPQETLKNFIYYSNYVELSVKELEVSKANLVSCKSKKVLFIGSGPLPLSAILLAKNGYSIDCIDKDKKSVALSRQLIKKLNLESTITIVCQDIESYQTEHEYCFIVLASLVGDTVSKKNQILLKLKSFLKNDTLLLARSSDDLAQLLYQPVSLEALKEFQIVTKIKASETVINSTFFVRAVTKETASAQEKVDILLDKYIQYKNKATQFYIAEKRKDIHIIPKLKKEIQSISESMKFDTPLIWLMYKYQAYKNTDSNISTLGDLRAHFNSPGDICYKRFHFLANYLLSELDINDKSVYNNNMSIVTFFNIVLIQKFSENKVAQKKWNEYEYFETNGEVSKWENYSFVK